jgi:nicotinamide riboside transporter PnuC
MGQDGSKCGVLDMTILMAIASIFGIVGVLFINYKDRAGYMFWIVSDVLLIWVNVASLNWWLVGLFSAYLLTSVHGWFMWKRKYMPQGVV